MVDGISSIRAHSPSALPADGTIESLKILAGMIDEILKSYGQEGGTP